MSSFFGKLKSNTDGKSSNNSAVNKQKPDPNAPQPTPLERMLQNAGPLRDDGSDKFWGMENFGNTCYCNSILQSLYYSVPFRQNIITYPIKSSSEAINTAAATATPRAKVPAQAKPPVPGARPTVIPVSQQSKPEDKDSPEYKKKQALLAGPILNMSYQNAKAYEMPENLYSSVKDVFEAVVNSSSRHGVVSPSKLVEVLRRDNEMFRGQIHQDAHEFLNLLLNTLLDNIDEHEKQAAAQKTESEKESQESSDDHNEPSTENGTVSFPSNLPLATEAPNKWLRDMFEGTLTSETRCLTCENVSQRDEPFLDLSVDLDQHTSVTACLRRFSEEEMLCERNKFHCDNCGGLQEAEKRMKIKRLPRVLALHLKRFKYTEDYGRLQKLFHKVVYPYHLRLFNTTDDADDPDRLYELYAVVVHIGNGPFHGHYVAVIKTQDRGWLLFDDEMVEPVDRSYVKNFFGDKPGQATAYVLFYQETTIEAVRAEQRRERKSQKSQETVNGIVSKPKDSVEIHRVQSSSPPLSPNDIGDFSRLDHVATAPVLQTNGHVDAPTSPLSPLGMTSPVLSQSKKEKAKEEKERKAAEKAAEKQAKKEKEKDDRERKQQLQDRLADAARQNADQMKKAMDESKKAAKDEDDRRKEARLSGSHMEEATSNGVSLGLDRFKRSKSLRFGSLGKKDKKVLAGDENGTNSSAVDDSPLTEDITKEKKNRFSLRKKSFGMLNP